MQHVCTLPAVHIIGLGSPYSVLVCLVRLARNALTVGAVTVELGRPFQSRMVRTKNEF